MSGKVLAHFLPSRTVGSRNQEINPSTINQPSAQHYQPQHTHYSLQSMTGATASTITFTTAAAICLTLIAYQQGKRHGRMQGEKTRHNDDLQANTPTGGEPPSTSNSNKTSDAPETKRTLSIKATKATPSDDLDMLPIYPIGTLRSIYRLCVGTPRQVSLYVEVCCVDVSRAQLEYLIFLREC